MKKKRAQKIIKELLNEMYKDSPSTNVKDGIANMLFYFDTIWDDRWWDSHYLLKIIEKKLEDMENNWKRSHHVDWQKDHKNIKRTRKLLNKLLNDEFDDKGYDKIRKKYADYFDIDIIAIDIKADKLFKKEMDKGQKKKKKCQKEFFELMKEYENWWD